MKPYTFRPWHLIVILFLCEVGFAALYYVGTHVGGPKVDHFYDLDQEANLPAWFSSMQLFSVAAVIAIFGPKALRPLGVPVIVPLIGAAAFLFLSMDEIAQVHERIGRELSGTAAPQVRNGRGAWAFVYGVAALPFIFLGIKYLAAIAQGYPRLVIYGVIGSVSFVAGAIGVELIADQFLRGYAEARELYVLSVLTEELLEMIGGTLILFGVMHLALPRAQPVYQLKPKRETVPSFGRIAGR